MKAFGGGDFEMEGLLKDIEGAFFVIFSPVL